MGKKDESLNITPGEVKNIVSTYTDENLKPLGIASSYKEQTIDDLRNYKATPEELDRPIIKEYKDIDERSERTLTR